MIAYKGLLYRYNDKEYWIVESSQKENGVPGYQKC